MQNTSLIHDAQGGLPRLLEIMRCLRDPETGCPWDIEQTYATIAPYTIEEAYEVADAIAQADWDGLEGELGDLLLQVVYYAQMGAEDGRFDFTSIANRISDKMVARHPHVFGDEGAGKTSAQQTRDWEVQKQAERAQKGETRTLDGVALGLPALTRALKLQKRAARVGFDWNDPGAVLEKLQEEAAELVQARNSAVPEKIADELGDMLFVLANLARHLDVDPEAALRGTNEKFTRRFAAIEDALAAEGRTPSDAGLAELETLWQAAKAGEPGRDG